MNNLLIAVVAFGFMMPSAALSADSLLANALPGGALSTSEAQDKPSLRSANAAVASLTQLCDEHAAFEHQATILQVDTKSRYLELLADGYRQPAWYPVANTAVIQLHEAAATLYELRPGDRVTFTIDRSGEQPFLVAITATRQRADMQAPSPAATK